MSGVIAEGTLYVDRNVAGVMQGLTKWEGLAKLEIKPNSELKEATSKDKGKYGQIVASVALAKPAELSLTLRDINREALAMALQGTGSALSQSGSSWTASAFTHMQKGVYNELGKRNVASAGFVVKDVTDTTTYTAGTDYVLNEDAGLLYIPSTSAIPDDVTLHITGTYAAVAGDLVKGGTLAQVRGKLFLDGNNLVDGTPLFVTIWDATLTSDGAVDFMADDLVELSMKGRMATPSGKDSPFEVELNNIFS
jgi:hypothetical protein